MEAYKRYLDYHRREPLLAMISFSANSFMLRPPCDPRRVLVDFGRLPTSSVVADAAAKPFPLGDFDRLALLSRALVASMTPADLCFRGTLSDLGAGALRTAPDDSDLSLRGLLVLSLRSDLETLLGFSAALFAS